MLSSNCLLYYFEYNHEQRWRKWRIYTDRQLLWMANDSFRYMLIYSTRRIKVDNLLSIFTYSTGRIEINHKQSWKNGTLSAIYTEVWTMIQHRSAISAQNQECLQPPSTKLSWTPKVSLLVSLSKICCNL